MAREGQITIEDAEIFYRNFAGKEQQFNTEGNRNFCVGLSDELYDQLLRDGWNVRQGRSGEDGEPGRKYLQVSLKYRTRDGRPMNPPLVVLVSPKTKKNPKGNRTTLTEDELEVLDWVDIQSVDVIIRPNDWNFNGNSGRKAYLKSIYVTQELDPLMLKYQDVPEIDRNGQLAIESGPGEEIWDAEVVEEEQLAIEE